MGHEGFSQESSLLYHRHSPSGDRGGRGRGPVHRLEPRSTIPCYRATSAPTQLPVAGDAIGDRTSSVRQRRRRHRSFAATTDASRCYRDAIGDELVYVQSGTAVLESCSAR